MEHEDAAVLRASAKRELADRVRAALRLISPDHITPLGKRQIERVLDEETAVAPPALNP
jgi:hypothetical protein